LDSHRKCGTQCPEDLKDLIAKTLDANKAEDIEIIDLRGLTSLADYMVVASGTSSRQVAALADKLRDSLSEHGYAVLRTEGLPTADWVVADAGDVIVHLFRPEVRGFYNIEKMWRPDPAFAEKRTAV
jgi:ribosome-associated protein